MKFTTINETLTGLTEATTSAELFPAAASEYELAASARDWFDGGERVSYDIRAKRILPVNDTTNSANAVQVFRRIESDGPPHEGEPWTTFLPGFPDGSFGWAKVNQLLAKEALTPKMFVEYVGQGDSDKPSDYPYSTMERADLVEAMWQAQGVKSTFVVAFDYSSIVLLELLSRQHERIVDDSAPATKIEKVLMMNGGLFADAHSHPWLTTPLLKTPMGKIGTWAAQHSKFVFNQMMKGLWSKEYNVTSEELAELYDAIGRRNGAAFMSNAAGFVDEHKASADRWDLRRLFIALGDSVSFHLVGSEKDPFEHKQIVKAKERLGAHGLDIRLVPGGHMSTSEYPDLLAEIILELGTD